MADKIKKTFLGTIQCAQLIRGLSGRVPIEHFK